MTGIVDCAPIRVVNPKRSRASRKLYQPKYGHAVLKIQIIVSFTGEIVFASFPHIGVMHDSKVFWRSYERGRLKFEKDEWILGDPAYHGCPHVLTKYPKRKLCAVIHGPLPAGAKCNCPKGRLPYQRRYNWIFDGVRGRVEKIIGQVVHHKSFNNVKNRSHYNLLVDSVKITLHAAALWSRLYPQYPGYGDWSHF